MADMRGWERMRLEAGKRASGSRGQGGYGNISVKQDFSHLGKLAAKLEKDKMQKLRSAVGKIGVEVGRRALERASSTSADPADGRPWAPHVRNLHHPVLKRTGKMLKARVVRFKRHESDYALKVFMTARKSFTDKHFWYMQAGDGRRGIPARRHIGFSGQDMDDIQLQSMREVVEMLGD